MRGVATQSFRATVAAPRQSARPGIARLKPLVEVGDDAMKYISPPVVIGGLTVATIATLFFVPTVFSIIHGRSSLHLVHAAETDNA